MQTLQPPSSATRLPASSKPVVEDWIVRLFGSRAPLGFEAGDENLYRYANNNPVATTDPSGLKGRVDVQSMPGWRPGERESYQQTMDQWRRDNLQDLPLGGAYPVRIYFYGGTVDQRRIVRERLSATLRIMERALSVLENNWPEIKRRYAGVIPMDYLVKGSDRASSARRQFYIDNIRLVLDHCRDHRQGIVFQIETEDLPDLTHGGVYRFGRVIYLYPVAFRGNVGGQINTIIHELGRRYPRILGDTGEGTNNINRWDGNIEILSQDYDLIRNPPP